MYRDMKGSMVRFPYVANPEMKLEDAQSYMKECDIRHLPLVKEDRIVGVVSERDILAQKENDKFEELSLGDIVKNQPFVVNQEEPLTTTLRIMAKSKFGSVLITDSNSQLVGIFTTTDALILLENLLNGESEFYQKPGTIVYLKDVAGWN